jgi:DNA repair protein RadC
MTYHVRVLDMPSSERPRERLLSYGPKNLSTAELLAILLNTGQRTGQAFGSRVGSTNFAGDGH